MSTQHVLTAAGAAPNGRVEACAVNTAATTRLVGHIDAGMRHEAGFQADPIKPVANPELPTE